MQKQASVHLTQIINKEKREIHLCDSCARECEEFALKSSLESDFPFSINALLAGLMGKSLGYQTKPEKEVPTQRCSYCGMTYHQFIQRGKLGCSNCYDLFSSTLEPAMKKIHGSTYHHGKIPSRSGEKIKIKREIDDLKEQLRIVISEEEYEKAAQLRDKIKLLVSQMEEGSN
jgi:protein arginine kinase activator